VSAPPHALDAARSAPHARSAAAAARAATWRFIAQRASAALLAVCVVEHLATIVNATRQGLSAAAMIGRAHATLLWPAFYALFVLAVAVHAPLGLRAILDEWAGLRGRGVDALLAVFALVLLVLGFNAVSVLA
jgi:fumarate reductase subunit C